MFACQKNIKVFKWVNIKKIQLTDEKINSELTQRKMESTLVSAARDLGKNGSLKEEE